MPVGPGKYDDACTAVRVATEAHAIVLIVIDGNQGSGFSVQASGDAAAHLPGLLRSLADQIEASDDRSSATGAA